MTTRLTEVSSTWPKFFTSIRPGPRKKTSLGESLAKFRAYNPIRYSGEKLGEREKSRHESCQDSHQESSRNSLQDSRWDFWRDSWRDFSRSPSVSPESRIGLYAWLSARLSPRLVFFTWECLNPISISISSYTDSQNKTVKKLIIKIVLGFTYASPRKPILLQYEVWTLPLWHQHFEFSKSKSRFVISIPENPHIQIFIQNGNFSFFSAILNSWNLTADS